jgi:integrator complex subunit 4
MTHFFIIQITEQNPDTFTTSILAQLATLSDPKPGRVFREILPIVQTFLPTMIPRINTNVSFVLKQMRKILDICCIS